MDVIIKSQETREGVRFRVLRDGKFMFADLPFQNYFYVKTQDYNIHKDEFHKTFTYCIERCEPHGQFTKIILSNNWLRVKTRNFWEDRCNTFEADIKANMRFLLDKHPKLNNEHVPYTFYDIETDDRLPLQKDERGNVIPPKGARVLSFSAVDHKGESVYFQLEEESDEAESKLLQTIIRYFADYGLISGWNSEKFDMPYIKARCDALGIDYSILDYVNHMCYMLLFKKYDKKSRPSFSLNAISNEVLDESKIDQEKGDGKIYNTWKNNPDQLKKYNLEDSNLIYKINKKRMFIEVSMKRADRACCHIRHTMNNSDSGDYLLMRAFTEARIVMPSKPTMKQVEERQSQGSIGGGYTTCFEPGLHENVPIFDFKSEYPSVIQTWNISPETYVETIHDTNLAKQIDKTKFTVTPSDFEGKYHPHRVYKREEGVVPRVVRMLVEERDVIKYTMKQYEESDPEKYKQQYLEQYAVKTDGNSIYGILAFPFSRYYSWEVADSVTTSARATLKACNKEAEEKGHRVLGGDTDSTFIILKDMTVEEANQMFIDFLKEWTDKWFAVTNKLVFEYEKTYTKFFFVMKKNYAFVKDGKIGMKGLECIKSDANPLAARLQKEFIYDILEENPVLNEKWEDKVRDLYAKVFDQELEVSDLLLTKAITKMPQDYYGDVIDSKTGKPKIKADGTIQKKAIPGHVRLAERLIAQGKDIYPGSKMKYIVIHEGPIIALSKKEYAKGEGEFEYKHKKKGEIMYEFSGEYDAKYYWMRILKPLIKVVYTYYGKLPEWDFNVTKGQMNKLMKGRD